MSKVIESIGLRGNVISKQTLAWGFCTYCAVCNELIPLRVAALRFVYCDWSTPRWMSRKTAFTHTGCIPLFGMIAVTDYQFTDEAQKALNEILARDWTEEIPVVDADGSQLGLDLGLGVNHG